MKINELIAKGHTAVIYSYGEDKILKVFNDFMPKRAVVYELRMNEIINSLLSNTPKVYDLIEYEGRPALIYERIEGEDLLQRMVKEYEGSMYSALFLELHKGILKVEIHESRL
ncbi:MAG: hypothetical protein Q4F66_14655 [Clostridium sp.]|nr:hypothetical protein [Clostridium sp.]